MQAQTEWAGMPEEQQALLEDMYSHILDNLTFEQWNAGIFENEDDVQALRAAAAKSVEVAASNTQYMAAIAQYKGEATAREVYQQAAGEIVSQSMQAFRDSGDYSEEAYNKTEEAIYKSLGMEKKKTYSKDDNGEITAEESSDYVIKSQNQANYLTTLLNQEGFSGLDDKSIGLLYTYRKELSKLSEKLEDPAIKDFLAFVYGKSMSSSDSNTKIISSLKSLLDADGQNFKDGAELVKYLEDLQKKSGNSKYTPFLTELQKRAELLNVTVQEIIDHLDTLGMIDGNGVLNSTFANVEAKFATLTEAITSLNQSGRLDAQTLDSLFTEFPDMMGKFLARYEGDAVNAKNLSEFISKESKYQIQQQNAVGANYILNNSSWFTEKYLCSASWG